ncbi:MAG TPA: glycosyltransferase family 2 protein [Terriglobales bacterium]
MPEQPLVSVITAFYNARPFLAEAIASVLAQTYTNWEYWLVNDGSTDGSDEIACSAAAANPERIFYLEHPNGENLGVCTSRNLGLQHARGRYVAILDADDVWCANKLQEQMTLAQQFPRAGLICGNSKYWKSWNGTASEREDSVPPLAPADHMYAPVELIRLNYPLGSYGAPCPSNLLIKTNVCRAMGGFEESFNRNQVFEDQAFLTKLYASTHVYIADRTWDYYRLHEDSCCSVAEKSGRVEESRKFYLEWLRDYLQSQEIWDERIWEAWRRATLPYRHPALYSLTRITSKLRRGLRGIGA